MESSFVDGRSSNSHKNGFKNFVLKMRNLIGLNREEVKAYLEQ